MRETWYVLAGGGVADPRDVVTEPDGTLRHKSGAAIAYGPHGPRARSMAPEEIEAARAERVALPAQDREMRPAKRAKYETR